MAARTVTAFIRATLGERDLSVGIVSSIQTHGSLANWHPHLHMLVTDGGFRSDGTFVRLPLHDVATLTEAFRLAVLQLFVKRELMDVETAQGMLAWPHSGFHVQDGVCVAAEDSDFALRPAQIRQICEICSCQGANLAHAFLRTLISSIFTMSTSSTKSTSRAASCRAQVVYVLVSQEVTPLGPYFGRTSISFVSTIRNFKSTIPHFKSSI